MGSPARAGVRELSGGAGGGWPGVPERRRWPANYLADVERAMTAKLRADQLYSGFTGPNYWP